jgi:D-methionine transport system substrate-binding protein
MKKILAVLVVLSLLTGFAALAESTATPAPEATTAAEAAPLATFNPRVTLKVLADLVPHSELLEFVKPKLAEQGIDLIITVAQNDHGNDDTAAGDFDVNFFQHVPYLNSVVAEKGLDLAPAGAIHVEPIGFYSNKYKTKDEIPDSAVIGIPNDTTNEYRALRILEQNGFIKLRSDLATYEATIQDIAEYVKPIKIEEIDAAQLVRLLPDLDGAIINTNRVLEAGIDANTALFREGADSPYANILVTTSARVNDPAIVALFQALTTEEVRDFILEKYQGAVVPAF